MELKHNEIILINFSLIFLREHLSLLVIKKTIRLFKKELAMFIFDCELLKKNYRKVFVIRDCFSKFKLPHMKDGKFIRDAQLTQNERAKHVHYMQRASDEVSLVICLSSKIF